jgi:polyhydroxyalkanoate synthesis repressor PhaR
MILIKRYRNRRLYHTGTKSFIVLADLERLIKNDEPFTVIDTATGRDVTVPVLTSVIGERAGAWKDLTAVRRILRAVIKSGGEQSMNILKNTVLAGIGFASLTKKKAEELVEHLIKTGEVSKSEKKEAVMELLSKAEGTAKDYKDRIGKEIDKNMKKFSPARKTDLEKLSRKVDKLVRVVSSLEKKIEGMSRTGPSSE